METPLHYLPVTRLASLLHAGEITAVDLIDHFLRRIEALDGSLHALITVAAEESRAQAVAADRALAAEDTAQTPLLGIPITVKDAVATRGIRTTANSRTRGDWVPDSEPLSITRLRDAGAIIIGKASCNEYFGIPSDEDRFPRPRTPFNSNYVAIGSSSGSGVAVAAGLCAASIGTDSAGSVRLPAAQAGVFGMKATNGYISQEGMGSHSTFQVIGPLARTTGDAALLTAIMAGQPVPDLTRYDVSGLRIGVPRHYITTCPVEPEIIAAFDALLAQLSATGAKVIEIGISGLAEARMATFVAMYTEHHAAHATRLQHQLNDYGRSARLYAMQGAFISAIDYLNALELGRRVQRNVDAALEQVDVIAMPTSPFVTAEAARRPSEHRRGMNTVFTCPFNLTGHPAITVPSGASEIGIPIGTQFVAAHGAEDKLYHVGLAIERETRWNDLHPSL